MGPEDEDVARERSRVEENVSLIDELLLNRLTKVFFLQILHHWRFSNISLIDLEGLRWTEKTSH